MIEQSADPETACREVSLVVFLYLQANAWTVTESSPQLLLQTSFSMYHSQLLSPAAPYGLRTGENGARLI
jgi:hypothetical protein